MRFSIRALLSLCAATGVLALAGCGNGTASSSTSPAIVYVSVNGPVVLRLGQTAQFSATVTGTSNTAVVWQVNGVNGGSPATGTISAAGLYTAPVVMPSSMSATISAVSAANLTSMGQSVETLENPVPVASSASALPIDGTTTYVVDIHGTGFVPGAVIQSGTTALATAVVSSTEVLATVSAPTGTTQLSVLVANPAPGAANSSALAVPLSSGSTSLAAAGRLLDQATFGPTLAGIEHVAQVGLSGYLDEQFAVAPTKLAAIPVNPLPALCLSSNAAYPCAESEWWQTAITAPDQLRQRVAFALSEMFVVSTQSVPGQAIPSFHNALAADAFGNFRTLMKDVTLSSAMGAYLNMLNSAKPVTGQIANENYPRELMQLFTTGLYRLNQDGTQQLDGSGNPIPVYTQAQVQAFARAYTGWTLANVGGAAVTRFPNTSGDYDDPMAAVDAQHDTTSKTLLDGIVLPAGQTAQQDLDGALDSIFNDTNVGPFVCRQLIQHLVTSTPSAAYVKRIATVFADNGSGVRGDMKAVVRAILTDTEARAGDSNANYDGGHLREPILFMTAMMRALDGTSTDANGRWDSLSNYVAPLSERPYRANSVFNFFPPGYVIPGTTLNAPEFGNENSATAILRLSLADTIVNNHVSSFSVDLSSTSILGTLAASPSNLVDVLNVLFMHGQMPSTMRSTILSAITPLTSNPQRARVALYLVITSSPYKIIH